MIDFVNQSIGEERGPSEISRTAAIEEEQNSLVESPKRRSHAGRMPSLTGDPSLPWTSLHSILRRHYPEDTEGKFKRSARRKRNYIHELAKREDHFIIGERELGMLADQTLLY